LLVFILFFNYLRLQLSIARKLWNWIRSRVNGISCLGKVLVEFVVLRLSQRFQHKKKLKL